MPTSSSYKVDTSHRDIIHDAQLNYYGNRLATCSSDRTVKVFEIRPNGASFPLAELTGNMGPVWQLSWAHPRLGSLLASAGYDKKVVIWSELAGGKYTKQHEWVGHESSVNSVAFAPYQLGLIIATGSVDCSIGILSFNEQTQWTSQKILKAHNQGVNAVSWAPAIPSESSRDVSQSLTRRLVSCGNENVIKIWAELDGDWKLERQLIGHSDFVRDVAWCPVVSHSTQLIASCGQDRRLMIWTSHDGGEFKQDILERADGALFHVSWSNCGTILSTSGEDNQISVWKQNLTNHWTKMEDY